MVIDDHDANDTGFIPVMIMMLRSVHNGDDHDATTVRVVLEMVTVATNLRVAVYW
jgi:hypothetical protein